MIIEEPVSVETARETVLDAIGVNNFWASTIRTERTFHPTLAGGCVDELSSMTLDRAQAGQQLGEGRLGSRCFAKWLKLT